MGSILFKAFHDLRDTMREKYGVEEIPYYVCVGINEKSPVRAINKTGVEFYDRHIGEFVKYYDQLKMALCNGYVVRFKWNGQPRTCIFARMTDGKTLLFNATVLLEKIVVRMQNHGDYSLIKK